MPSYSEELLKYELFLNDEKFQFQSLTRTKEILNKARSAPTKLENWAKEQSLGFKKIVLRTVGDSIAIEDHMTLSKVSKLRSNQGDGVSGVSDGILVNDLRVVASLKGQLGAIKAGHFFEHPISIDGDWLLFKMISKQNDNVLVGEAVPKD